MSNLEELIELKNKNNSEEDYYQNLRFDDFDLNLDLDNKQELEKETILTKNKKSFLKTEKDVFNKMLEFESDLNFQEKDDFDMSFFEDNKEHKNIKNYQQINKEIEEMEILKKESNKILTNAFQNFKEKASEKLDHNRKEEEKRLKIIEEKKKVLLPIRNLFNRFMEMQLMVKNSKKYLISPIVNKEAIKTIEEADEVFFKFYKKHTIGGNAPGIDFVIKHPCEITITVLNKKIERNKETKEAFEKDYEIRVIVEETRCPHVDLIKKDFKTSDSACMALSSFFALNAEDIKNPDALEK